MNMVQLLVTGANDTLLEDGTAIYIHCTSIGVTADYSGRDGITPISFTLICEVKFSPHK